jgi:nitric oxide reductase large subunit
VAFGTPVSRKLLLTMASLVVGLDAVAIALYYALGIARRANNIQMAFVVVWTLATLGIVLVYMKRIRRIRDAAIGRRRPAGP